MHEEVVTQPPPPASGSALSIAQMLHLMRLEMERAQHHDYPITCLMIGLDGFDDPEDLPERQILIHHLFQTLKVLTVEQEVRGLGLSRDQGLLAVFPHTAAPRVAQVADDLLARGRELSPSGILEDRTITLSIGLGHNQHKGPMSFEILLEEAETGMHLAQSGGGDRCVQWKEVESEIDRLRDELKGQIEEISNDVLGTGAKAGFEEQWGRDLVDSILTVFAAEPEQSPGVVRLQQEVITLIHTELARFREFSMVQELTQREKKIDVLERRIHKLTEHLDATESELKRIAAMKSLDLGIASIYSTVQGLSLDADNAEQKREMLQCIFEANLAIQQSGASE